MESTLLTKTRFTSFYSNTTNYLRKRYLYLLVPLFIFNGSNLFAQCINEITGQETSMNVSLSAAGSATIQVGGHVFGFGFPANSVTGTLRISEPVSCASPTYFIYKQNGTNLGALVASGSGSFFTLTSCSDPSCFVVVFLGCWITLNSNLFKQNI